MKKIYTLFLILFCTAYTFGQPANDECTNPEVITVTNTLSNFAFDINSAVISNETICTTTEDIADVWYEFVMPFDGNIFVDGIITWNNFALYNTCGSAAIDCGNTKDLYTNLTSGNTYYLRVYRTASATAYTNYQNFNIKAFPTVTNDDCASAENITVTTTSSTVNFEIGGASENNEVGCSGMALDHIDLWYDFTMPVNGNLYIDASIIWNNIALYDSCGGTLLQCGGANQFISGLTSGTNYKLRIFRTSTDADNSYNSFNIIAYESVNNDDCASAENITVTTTESTVDFEIGGGTINNEMGCYGTAVSEYVDVWYDFTMPVNGNLHVDGLIAWNNFALYDVCGSAEIQCGSADQLFTSLSATTNYKLRVFRTLTLTTKNDYRAFTIQAFEVINNDDCASAETISVSDAETTINFEIAGATINNEVGCSGTTADDYADVWYDFTMPEDGSIIINGSINWNNFALYDACNGNELSCFEAQGTIDGLISGTTYKLRVFRHLNLSDNQAYKNFIIYSSAKLSIDKTILEHNISIYPNPVHSELNILLKNNQSISSIELFNMLGKKIASTTALKLDVSNYSAGIYILKISTKDGHLSKKIIIE